MTSKQSTPHLAGPLSDCLSASNLLRSAADHQCSQIPQGGVLFLTPAQCRVEGLPIACRDTEAQLLASKVPQEKVFFSAILPDRTPYFISLSHLKARLYQLTYQFVLAHHFTYFKQFRGDLRDLVSGFYYEFCTPKSRKGPKLTLIDRYDFTITSFEYYVKQAVIRKLIDQSRQNPYQLSIESLTAESGDAITRTFHLVTPAEAMDNEVPEEQLALYRSRFSRMSEVSRQAVRATYETEKEVLSPRVRRFFESLFEGVFDPRPTRPSLAPRAFTRPLPTSNQSLGDDVDLLVGLLCKA